MNHIEAKAYKEILDKEVDKYSRVLNSFEKGTMGIVPSHIRESNEYKEVKKSFDIAFTKLRNFNAWYVKEFIKKKKK